MGTKRKLAGQSGDANAATSDRNESSKLGPIRTYEDVADSEDEFHLNRNNISFGDGYSSKRRKQEEEELLEPSDDEVLAYSSGSDDEDYGEAESEVEAGRAALGKRTPASEEDRAAVEQEEEAGWGSSKRDYYDADEIENEEDAMEEEAEARRLQQKRLQDMSEADFGFDEAEWLIGKGEDQTEEADGDERRTVTEVLPQLDVTDEMGPEERHAILKTRYPEFEPLASEFLHLHARQNELGFGAAVAQISPDNTLAHSNGPVVEEGEAAKRGSSVVGLKFQALSAYLGALSMYFALLTSPSKDGQGKALAMSATKLRDHPVMDSLVKCRELWNKMKDIEEPQVTALANGAASSAARLQPADAEDMNALPDGQADQEEGSTKKRKRSKKQLALESAQREAEQRRAERIRKNESELATLDSLIRPSINQRQPQQTQDQRTNSALTRNGQDEDSDFGEETHLSAHDAAEKARKKKSLRFYTSQIAQKSQRRDRAGRDTGGDADVPYRERFKDRQARLNAAAEKRGRHGEQNVGGHNSRADDFDSGSESGEDAAAAADIRAEADADAAAYYDQVASAPNRAQRRAALQQPIKKTSTVGHNEPEGDGKRGLSYAIATNKGLTPKRKKEVRNPRVKKRVKFAEKQKKLGSVRQVYRGGEDRGGYGGEKTGIKSGLVRSRKL